MAGRQLPPGFADTRDALHRIAEHVLAAACHAVTGRISLRPAPGGFGTPPFGDDGRVIAVDGLDLVVRAGGEQRRTGLTTVAAAAAFAGIEPGAPAEVYHPATPLEPEAPLRLEPLAARLIADWYALAADALARFAASIPQDEPSEARLWPEHFDLGIVAGEVNYGASPGDEHVPDPYLYVGPHGGPPPGDPEFWNAPFGAVRTIHDVRSVDDAVAFFRAGHDRVADKEHTP